MVGMEDSQQSAVVNEPHHVRAINIIVVWFYSRVYWSEEENEEETVAVAVVE